MKNTSGILYRQLADFVAKEPIEKVEAIFNRFGEKWYIIGALARNAEYAMADIEPHRATADIDFAVMIPNYNLYKEITNALLKSGFDRVNGISHRFKYVSTSTLIDIIPYGGIAKDDLIILYEPEETKLSVAGFMDVAKHVSLVGIDDGYDIPVAPIEGIFILKLVAWSENPEKRERDVGDLMHILSQYFDLREDEIYQQGDLFEDEDYHMEKAAARALGRKIRSILENNPELIKKVIELFDSDDKKDFWEQEFLKFSSLRNYEHVGMVINELITGLKEKVATRNL